jgi:hypothetical protein
VEGGNGHAADQQQQGQRRIAGDQPQAGEHGRRYRRRKNDEIAHADAVGQVANEGVEHTGQLREDGQAAGQGVADAQLRLKQWQQRRQERRVGVLHQVADADGGDLAGLEAGVRWQKVGGGLLDGDGLVGHGLA